jgi:hypothetical protein
MAEIVKFSLAYDAPEDRIAWDLEDADGATTRLWLTQRFCRLMISAVLPLLAKSVAEDAAPERETTLQAWEQAAAMSDFGRTSGVKVAAESTAGLVSQVQLGPSNDGGVTFTFGPGNETRVIGTSGPALRQTLAVFYRLHEAAGWMVELFPAWIADPNAVAGVADTGLVN